MSLLLLRPHTNPQHSNTHNRTLSPREATGLWLPHTLAGVANRQARATFCCDGLLGVPCGGNTPVSSKQALGQWTP